MGTLLLSRRSQVGSCGKPTDRSSWPGLRECCLVARESCRECIGINMNTAVNKAIVDIRLQPRSDAAPDGLF